MLFHLNNNFHYFYAVALLKTRINAVKTYRNGNSIV